MFKRLRLWYWKWFRPSQYTYHVAKEVAAAIRAGLVAEDKEVNP